MAAEFTSVLKLFYCYAREDKALRDDLDIHLSGLKRQNHIIAWYDREISPGIEWEREIDAHLNAAHIILLLVSPHFMASDYCYGIEMKRALERHKAGVARVIPILLRPVDWEDAPFSNLQILPTDARPITTWSNHDEALWDVARGIRRTTKELRIRLCIDQANVFYNLKQFEDAINAFEQAINLDANNAEAHIGKGKTLYNLQYYERAFTTFEQAERALDAMLALASDHQQCLSLLSNYTAFLASLGRWTDVLRYTKAALHLAPNDPIWLAGERQAQTKIQEASQKPQEQKQINPTSPQKSQEQLDDGNTRQGSSNESRKRGADLRYDLTITFEEAVFGCQKEIEPLRWETCANCGGSGAQPGTSKARCSACQGTGEIRRVQESIFGQFVNKTMCERCRGEGKVITTPCEKCRGQGRVRNNRHMVVNIPAGVDDGINVRVTGEGEVSARGGTPGNLYVVLTVKPHPIFKRQGNDIIYELPVSFAQTALGDELEVPTVDGKSTLLKIPAGTQSGRSFRLKGMGVPVVHSSARGDQHVIVKVVTPTNLTPEQRRLLEEFARIAYEDERTDQIYPFRTKQEPSFERRDNDIILELPISFPQAALGDEIEIPTMEGKTTTLKIPAGTHSGRSFRLKGMGILIPNSSARGDQHVIAKVITPTHLTPEQKGLLEEFARL